MSVLNVSFNELTLTFSWNEAEISQIQTPQPEQSLCRSDQMMNSGLMHLLNQSRVSLSCQPWCFTYIRVITTLIARNSFLILSMSHPLTWRREYFRTFTLWLKLAKEGGRCSDHDLFMLFMLSSKWCWFVVGQASLRLITLKPPLTSSSTPLCARTMFTMLCVLCNKNSFGLQIFKRVHWHCV